MTKFRGCIDIHRGAVKQIVGGTLTTAAPTRLQTNHTSPHASTHFSTLYKSHNVTGSHVILLDSDPATVSAARAAVSDWPGGLQVGGGVTGGNAGWWVGVGAAKVIVTSWLFPGGEVSVQRLEELVGAVGKERVVIDLSCRRVGDGWMVAMNRWETVTRVEVCKETLDHLSQYCSEFLIHAADVEGLCRGIDIDLVRMLASCVSIPTTYAGGGRDMHDLLLVREASGGKLDLTFGTALDIFGGSGVAFSDCVEWNLRNVV